MESFKVSWFSEHDTVLTYAASNIASELDKLRKNNKDKWIMINIPFKRPIDSIVIKYKAFNAWVQTCDLHMDGKRVLQVGSSMDLKPSQFKQWLTSALLNCFDVAIEKKNEYLTT